MKFSAAAYFVFFLSMTTFSQNAKLDSLDKLISLATTDTAKINLTNKKSKIISEINIDSAIDMIKKTIEKSKSTKYKSGEATARVTLASNYCMKGTFASANENLLISQAIFRSLKDSIGLCNVYSGYGMMYGMQSKYDTSIQYLEKAIGIAERNKFIDKLATYYGNIAIGYQQQSNFLKALEYQQKSLDIAKAKNDISAHAYTSLNMGITYNTMGDTIRSKQFMLEAVKLAKMDKIKNVELYAYSNLASIYSKTGETKKWYDYAMEAARLGKQMGDFGIQASSLARAAEALAAMKKYTEAETIAKQALTIADSSGQTFNIFQAYAYLGNILKQQEKYNAAIPFFEKSIAALEKTDLYNEEVGDTYNDLSSCYEKTGNFSKALSFYKTSAKITDSIRSRDNIRKATELNMNYEFDKKQEAQRAAQNSKDAVTQARQTALITAFALAFILAAVALFAYYNKQKANALLRLQKEEIQNALTKLKTTQVQLIHSEKMASLGELTAGIAHEIQNPLNFVNNFSEVNTELIEELKGERSKVNGESDEQLQNELLNDIKENEQKIGFHGKRADAIVKGMLLHSRAETGKKELTDINALADEYLRLSYHGIRAKDKFFTATMHTSFDESIGKINIVPQNIGRVLLNLYNNAFYAVNEKAKLSSGNYQPIAEVRTRRINDMVEITVSDNGNGVPQKVVDKIFQPFFTTKPTGQGTGLGLSLSYDIVKGHNGEIRVETKEGEGSEFIIKLPV